MKISHFQNQILNTTSNPLEHNFIVSHTGTINANYSKHTISNTKYTWKCTADINNQNCIEHYKQTSWLKMSEIKDEGMLLVTPNTSSTQPNCVHLSNQYRNQDWTSTT